MKNDSLPSIVLIAQTPPPFHGQSVMQKYLVDANWPWCRKFHIRLAYSEQVADIGHFHFKKIVRLYQVIAQLRKLTSPKKANLIYYPPAGPFRIPLYRDVITLWFARHRGYKVLLHFHAGGLDQLVNRLTAFELFFVKKVFYGIDYAVVLLPSLCAEVNWFRPKQVFVIPNGIEDKYEAKNSSIQRGKKIEFLFVGNLTESKGIFDLLEAVRLCKKAGLSFAVKMMGASHSEEIKTKIDSFIGQHRLEDEVVLLGTLSGDAKWAAFKVADVFCLPTFATEAMPVSILEAMMCGLPVISTQWRAIPDIVTNGEEGFLVPVKDPVSLAEKMQYFIQAPENIFPMGQRGRLKYSQEFTVNKHLARMENLFKQCV